MKIAGFLMIGINVVMASPLRADPTGSPGVDYAQASAHLQRHEKNLERMQAERNRESEHIRQAQEEFSKSFAEMSGHAEQQLRDVQDLRSVENQVTAGRKQKTLAHQSYKETVKKYGSNDPRCATAKKSWKESQQAMKPLRQSRRTLKKDIHLGSRQVHNDKTMLGIQKRAMNSAARYRAIDDRKIKKEEKNIAESRRTIAQNVRSTDEK